MRGRVNAIWLAQRRLEDYRISVSTTWTSQWLHNTGGHRSGSAPPLVVILPSRNQRANCPSAKLFMGQLTAGRIPLRAVAIAFHQSHRGKLRPIERSGGARSANPTPPPARPLHTRDLLTRLSKVRNPPTDDRICGQNHCVRVNLAVRSSMPVPFVLRGTERVSKSVRHCE